eukprot:4326455-Pyramimonas_sp.AAC.1
MGGGKNELRAWLGAPLLSQDRARYGFRETMRGAMAGSGSQAQQRHSGNYLENHCMCLLLIAVSLLTLLKSVALSLPGV